ncbi:Spy/CpxP family protein refolding chaperone [Waterburya agarophytonicola K14]|uniref:Spy/CpxP family protein refolding chaperone n=1 Tax=Waterburya agarophytonicola KI4 TaxID=2874699 RepID=A0A964BWY8_9CYAN|nr:Spy/CpxP family protein refolding chaperone [Waterburya agarophytonicola KI4]
MNWKTFIVATGALAILPLGIHAAQVNSEVNDIHETNNMRHFAQRIKHGKRGDRGQVMNKLLQQLDLTEEQSQSIETIRSRSQTTAEDLHEQMKAEHQEIKSLLTSDADTEQIRQQFQETQALHQQLGNNRFETMLEIREVLTSEQRAKIAELMEQHQGRKGGFFQ